MKRIAEYFVDLLVSHAEVDSKLWVLDGDLADSYGATVFAEAFPDRFVMAGIAEQNMISMAAGMASCGARPFVFSFAAFLAYRAADQIRVGMAQSGLPVTLVASHAGGCVGRNGRSHSAIGDIALMASMPGMEIWAPADRHDVLSAFTDARSRNLPVYCRAPREKVGDLGMPPGALRVSSLSGSGEDGIAGILLLGSGLSAHWVLELQQTLQSSGISCRAASVARVHPLPDEIVPLVGAADLLVVVEDHVRIGGLADLVAARCGRLPDKWFGWSGYPIAADAAAARKQAGLDAEQMAAAVRQLIGR